MLVADVDDTLTGDDEALASLLAALREAGTVRLVLDSSRPIASVATTLAGLPVEVAPDAVVGALGTEVVIRGEPRPEWQERFAGFDRAPVDLVMAALGWPPHPPELQTPFKASFAIPPAGRSEAERRVAGTGLAARCVYGDADFFDVIPAGAGKEAPLGYLATHLGVDRRADRCRRRRVQRHLAADVRPAGDLRGQRHPCAPPGARSQRRLPGGDGARRRDPRRAAGDRSSPR